MEMGLIDFVDPSKYTKPVHEVIREMSKGGVDYNFECAGNLDVFREALTSTHDGGGLTVLLGIHTNPRLLPLHPMELHGRSILGCDFGGFKGKSQLPGLVDKCIEEVAASMPKNVDAHIPNYPNLPSKLICVLHNVTLHADQETDDNFSRSIHLTRKLC